MNRTELLEIAKPILFNTDMVRAILDGRKTVTRRVVKPSSKRYFIDKTLSGKPAEFQMVSIDEAKFIRMAKPQYKVNDILYVRETWNEYLNNENMEYCYLADMQNVTYVDMDDEPIKWKPSIHMPKSAARIFLKVTDVRVERLQDIDKYWGNYDKEGMRNPKTENISIAMQERFIDVWDNTIKKQDVDKYNWNANPWVWVYEFERIEI